MELRYTEEHYNHYMNNGDKNYFEELVDRVVLEATNIDDSIKRMILSLPSEKKRMALLSIIDDERSLFKNIKSNINSGIGRMDHIEDVVLMLRKYVKDAEVQKKKFGEVMTPIELVKEMLLKLPNHIWSNPNLKWLDPANGSGPFPSIVVYKLMKGLSEWEPDDDKRYRHIMENMIYVAEIQPKNMFLYMCAFDPCDIYKLNVYTGSFLDEGFNRHMSDVWNVDKFDIIIGNPPYNDGDKTDEANKLYPRFIYNSMSLLNDDGILTMITPTGWFTNTADIGKGKSGISLLNEFKKHDLFFLNPNSDDLKNKYFSGIGSTFCYFCLRNSDEYSGTTINGSKIDITKFESLPKYLNDLSFSINKKFDKVTKSLSKFTWIDQNHNLLLLESKVETDLYKNKNYHTPAKGITWVYSPNTHPNSKDVKVIVSISGKYKPYLDNGEYGFSNMCMAVITDDANKNNVFNNLNNKLFRFMVESNKFSGFNPRKYILTLPKLEIVINSDRDVYDYFKLSDEEIYFIESKIN